MLMPELLIDKAAVHKTRSNDERLYILKAGYAAKYSHEVKRSFRISLQGLCLRKRAPSRLSHPGYKASSSQEILHLREKISSGSLATYTQISRADKDPHSKFDMAARELFQQAVPFCFNDSASLKLNELSRDAQSSAGAPLHPRPMLGTHRCRPSQRAVGSKGRVSILG